MLALVGLRTYVYKTKTKIQKILTKNKYFKKDRKQVNSSGKVWFNMLKLPNN